MDLKAWHQVETGGIIVEGGNALKNFTGCFRRQQRPLFNEESCINCFLCWVFCPDNAIIVENEKVIGINYDYCKGCGICVNECSVKEDPKPLLMVNETFEL